MANFQFDAPVDTDRAERKGNSLPPFKILNYKSGKTGELGSKKLSPETAKEYFANGDVGFSYYDKELGTIHVKEGTFALLGLFWKLNTYTGGKKDIDRYSSNMVLDIKRDEMQIYRNGEPTKHKGIYKELKEQNIWEKETKISMYWVMMELTTDKIYAIEMTNTVKNGIKRSVLKAYSKPISAQSIEREGLYGLFDSPDNFHCFTLLGCNLANEKGMPYKFERNEGDSYFMPHFQLGILRREKQPQVADKLLATRNAFFTALAEKQGKDVITQPAYEKVEDKEDSLGDIVWPEAEKMKSGTAAAQSIAAARRDPFEEDPNDLPF